MSNRDGGVRHAQAKGPEEGQRVGKPWFLPGQSSADYSQTLLFTTLSTGTVSKECRLTFLHMGSY